MPDVDVVFALEPATADDLNFIRSSWLRSFAAQVTPTVHIKARDILIERCPPIVARQEGLPTSICGWACFEPGVIHYVFVKTRWQRNGIARMLLEPFLALDKVFYTHKTRDLWGIKLPEGWIYNPYATMTEAA